MYEPWGDGEGCACVCVCVWGGGGACVFTRTRYVHPAAADLVGTLTVNLASKPRLHALRSAVPGTTSDQYQGGFSTQIAQSGSSETV